MLASSGFLAKLEVDLCVGCGACAAACPFDAIRVQDGLAKIDDSLCMGCGVCVAKCPQHALALELAPEKGEPLIVHDLLAATRG